MHHRSPIFFALIACTSLATFLPLPSQAQVLEARQFVVDVEAMRAAPLLIIHETARTDTAFASRPADPWLAMDKAQHLVISFALTLSGQYTLVNKLELTEGNALPLSATATALVGLAKEWYDHRSYGYFSTRDLAADALGIAVAVLLISL